KTIEDQIQRETHGAPGGRELYGENGARATHYSIGYLRGIHSGRDAIESLTKAQGLAAVRAVAGKVIPHRSSLALRDEPSCVVHPLPNTVVHHGCNQSPFAAVRFVPVP